MNLAIFITTAGRLYRQITYDGLPFDLQKEVTVVCPPAEVAGHESLGRRALACPADGKGLAKKREWLLEYCRKKPLRYACFLDDDLTLQRRVNVSTNFIRRCTGDECWKAFGWLERMLKEGYAHAGWAPRTVGRGDPKPHITAKRHMWCLAFDVKQVVTAGASFSRGTPPFASMSDFYMTLQLLTAGLPNILSMEWRVDARTANAAGGCSAYRTTETIRRSAEFLAGRFPKYVTVVEKESSWKGIAKQGAERETQPDVRVKWVEALKGAEQ